MAQQENASFAPAGSISQAAFDALFIAYKNDVYRFACYLARNQREAEDLFQETWLRVVKHKNKVTPQKDAKAWLLTITANLYRDDLRKKRIRRLFSLRKEDDRSSILESAESPWRGNPSPGEMAEQAEMGRAIDKAVARLPERQRSVFVLKEIEGLKHAEISEILGVPIGTIKTLFFRAVKRLQNELQAYKPQKKAWEENEKCGVKMSSVF